MKIPIQLWEMYCLLTRIITGVTSFVINQLLKELMKLDLLKLLEQFRELELIYQLFEEAEWKKLKEWNQKTNDRIHDAALPTTKSGKYFILPPSDDIEDTINF